MQHPPCDCHVCGDGRSPEKYPNHQQEHTHKPCQDEWMNTCEPTRPRPQPCHDEWMNGCEHQRPNPKPCRPIQMPCEHHMHECDTIMPEMCIDQKKPCRPTPPPSCEKPKPCGKPSWPKTRPIQSCMPTMPVTYPQKCTPPRMEKRERAEGVLLQKIVASERINIPRHCTQLKIEGLPCCAQPPFKLVMVQQSGAQPWWTPLENQNSKGRLCFKVCIPVCCQVCDSCGKLYDATAVVEVEASLRPSCAMSDCWRHSIFISPCVRLCAAECFSEDCVFEVELQISLDIFMVRPEPCMMHKPERDCPDIPLYPQPCATPPCWQQCQGDRDRCGWPKQG